MIQSTMQHAGIVPADAVLLAKADSDSGVVVPTLKGVCEAITDAFAVDVPLREVAWLIRMHDELGASILAELERVAGLADEPAAQQLKVWVGRTLRAVVGWRDANSPEKDVAGLLPRLTAQQRSALVLLGDYAIYRARRCAVLQQLPRAAGDEVDVPAELTRYPPPPCERVPGHDLE